MSPAVLAARKKRADVIDFLLCTLLVLAGTAGLAWILWTMVFLARPGP
jgi:hypothetical protein